MPKAFASLDLASALLDLASERRQGTLGGCFTREKIEVRGEEAGTRVEIGRKSLPCGTSLLPPVAREGIEGKR
jgi:hypothetical protein